MDADFSRVRQLASLLATAKNDYSPDEGHHRQKRNAFKHMKWPNARIPYTLDPGFDDHQRAEVARAFENYHNNTCVRFVPRQESDADYLSKSSGTIKHVDWHSCVKQVGLNLQNLGAFASALGQ